MADGKEPQVFAELEREDANLQENTHDLRLCFRQLAEANGSGNGIRRRIKASLARLVLGAKNYGQGW